MADKAGLTAQEQRLADYILSELRQIVEQLIAGKKVKN